MTVKHIAVAGPMDVRRLVDRLGLEPTGDRVIPAGRGGHSVTELVLAMARQTDRLDLVTLDRGLGQPVEFRGEGIRLAVGTFRPRARDRSRDLFRSERRFIEDQLRAWQPAVVSAHWTYEYALGSLDSRTPTLTTVRDWGPTILRHSRDAYRTVRLGMQALVFARGRDFAAVSPYMASKVQRLTQGPVIVLPNALGPEWFTRARGAEQTQRVVAINNGFGRRKNVQSLLTAWAEVRKSHPGAELLLAGTDYGPDGAARSWARKRKLASGVNFLGQVNRSLVPDLLQSATIFAHPALEESFGMVVLEAMALGVPVLGGDKSGAVPWLLQDGAGLLVDVQNPREIADGLSELLGSPTFAEDTAQRAQDRARQNFAVEDVARSYLEHLSTIAARAG